MAAYNKFNVATLDQINADHDWNLHTFKIMLTNSAPVATNTIKANLTELATGNGYTQGAAGLALTISTNQTGAAGTARAVPSSDITITASGGSIGPFRYVAIYNDTQTTPAKPLWCWYDYGAAGVTLADGESFVTDFDNTNTGGLFGLV